VYRKGGRMWDANGRRLHVSKPKPTRSPEFAIREANEDGLVEFDPSFIVAPSGTKRLNQRWAADDRERALGPTKSLMKALMRSGVDEDLIADS
jgi:hypothetical protein